jgi:hypothetical protein
MSLRGVEMSLRGVEMSLRGVEMSLRGVEMSLRGVEMSLRVKEPIMKPVGLFLLLSLCVTASGVVCAQTYKCVEQGKLTISDTPCPPGAVSTVVPPEPRGSASSESFDEEMARLRQNLEAMERERHERKIAEIAQEQAKREEAAQKEDAEQKAQEEKIEAENEMARRNFLLKKKKKKREEEERHEN